MNLAVNTDKLQFLHCFNASINYLKDKRALIYQRSSTDLSDFAIEDMVARAVGEFLYLMVTFNDSDPASFWDNVFEEYLLADILSDNCTEFGTLMIADMRRFIPSLKNQLGIIGRTLNDCEQELEMTMTLYFEGCPTVSFIFQGVPDTGGTSHDVGSSAIL